jgi:hypothetical protein
VPLSKPRPSAVLNNPGTLPQGNGSVGPAFDRKPISAQRELVILDASNVLDDVLAGGVPQVDAGRRNACG